MLTGALIAITILYALGLALRSDRGGQLIARRPYNNRYSDAAAAREDYLG